MDVNLKFSQSCLDEVGRILVDDNGDIYRGIRPLFAHQIREIVGLADANDWYAHGLIPTSIADHQVDGFPLVLKHMRIPFVTVRGEWPARALRKAALCHLDLSLALFRAGYCLKDAHCYNILFSGTRPYFIDFGSIRPLHEINQEHWFREFNFSMRTALTMFQEGRFGLARLVLREHMDGVGVFCIVNDPIRLMHRPLPTLEYNQASLEKLREWVGDLSFPKPPENPKKIDMDDGDRPADPQIKAVIDKLSFNTAIELRAGHGMRSFMCAARGAKVLACDGSEARLNNIYDRAESESVDLTPLYVETTRPLGASGAFGTVSPQQQRLRCDLVLALGMIHRLSMRGRFYPDIVIAAIAEYTRDMALVEFIPPEDESLSEMEMPPLDGYSLEGVETALRRHFERVEHVPLDPEPRRLFICRGKRPQ